MHKTTESALIDKYEGQLGGWVDRPSTPKTNSFGTFTQSLQSFTKKTVEFCIKLPS
ncbi:hypothetical protein QUB43_16645 [Microcoleus sp. A6-D4]